MNIKEKLKKELGITDADFYYLPICPDTRRTMLGHARILSVSVDELQYMVATYGIPKFTPAMESPIGEPRFYLQPVDGLRAKLFIELLRLGFDADDLLRMNIWELMNLKKHMVDNDEDLKEGFLKGELQLDRKQLNDIIQEIFSDMNLSPYKFKEKVLAKAHDSITRLLCRGRIR